MGACLASTTARAWHRMPAGPNGWRATGLGAIRGMTIGPIESSLYPGRGYGTRYTEETLDELVDEGVTWIAITPFGRLWDLRTTFIDMEFEAPYEDNRRAVKRMIRQAKERGLGVLVVPHLWVDMPDLWRGEIEQGTPERWRAYHEAFTEFVVAWARDAAEAGADMLSIGVECKSFSGRFGAFWTEHIRRVREVFPGYLTYSANWDEAEDVVFWDQLDLIGINAFYPLADHDDATDAEYLAGARRAMHTVRGIARAHRMPAVLVEIGYTTRPNAAVEPWLWPDGMTNVVIDEREQARALGALLAAFAPEPWLAGVFVWRYYADRDDVSQEATWGYSPRTKRAMDVLRFAFSHEWGADPPPWPWSLPPPSQP